MAKGPPVTDVAAGRLLALRRVIGRLEGARMCFGEPVKAGDRVIVPVAKVFTAGGFGYGSGDDGPALDGLELDRGGGTSGSGGGGGGTLAATPVGFIEVSAGGSRFRSIPDPERSAKVMTMAIRAVPALLAAAAGVRAWRDGAGHEEIVRALSRRRVRRRLPRLPA